MLRYICIVPSIRKLWKFNEYFCFVARERGYIPRWNFVVFQRTVRLPASAFLEQCQDTDYATNLKLTERVGVGRAGVTFPRSGPRVFHV